MRRLLLAALVVVPLAARAQFLPPKLGGPGGGTGVSSANAPVTWNPSARSIGFAPAQLDASTSTAKTGGTGAVSRSFAAWLGDTVNVKGFGAKGDGSTDDTAAIQAAINAGAEIFFPPGNYKVTNALNLTNTTGKRLRGSGPVSTQIQAYVAGKPVIDCSGANGCSIENLTVYGQQSAMPTIGVLFYRATTGVTSGNHSISGSNISGYYSIASVATVSSEGNHYLASMFQNLQPAGMSFYNSNSNTAGITSPFVTLATDPTGGNTVGEARGVSFNCLSVDPAGVCVMLDGTSANGSGPLRHFDFNGCFFTQYGGNLAGVEVKGTVHSLSVHQSSGEVYGRYGWYLAPNAVLENFSMLGSYWDRGLYGDAGSQVLSSHIDAHFAPQAGAPDPPGQFGINLDTLNWSYVNPHALNMKVRTEATDNVIVGSSRNVSSGALVTLPATASMNTKGTLIVDGTVQSNAHLRAGAQGQYTVYAQTHTTNQSDIDVRITGNKTPVNDGLAAVRVGNNYALTNTGAKIFCANRGQAPPSTPDVMCIDKDGAIQIGIGNTSDPPACDVNHRGTFWYTGGAAGVKDSVTICAKDAANAYAWRTVY